MRRITRRASVSLPRFCSMNPRFAYVRGFTLLAARLESACTFPVWSADRRYLTVCTSRLHKCFVRIMARVLILSRANEITNRLADTLSNLKHSIAILHSLDRCDIDLAKVDAVFACGDPPECLTHLKRVRKLQPALAVFVVSRVQDLRTWLDVLDGGANDFFRHPMTLRDVTRAMDYVAESTRPVKFRRSK